MSVVQYRKPMFEAPLALPDGKFVVRTHRDSHDAATWLELRERAFARESPLVRRWTMADFQREMLAKWWWNSDRSWLAVLPNPAQPRLIGSVTLAMRGAQESAVPIVQWLMVDPEWRGRGLGRVLLSRLELAAWELGYREVCLETHSGWQAAVALYENTGYRQVGGRQST